MDLGENIQADTPGTTRAARLAQLSVNPVGGSTTPEENDDKRRFYHRPEVTPVRDTYFSQAGSAKITDYDIITITSGYQAHPLDLSIQDRVYAIRDYLIDGVITTSSGVPDNYPQCLNGTSLTAFCGGPLTESNLFDTTDNLIQVGNDTQQAAAITDLQSAEGWYIVFQEPGSPPTFVGEKGLAPTTVFNGILFFSTYIPSGTAAAEGSCIGAEGLGRLWAIDLLSGAAVFEEFSPDTSTLNTADRFKAVGAGIPTQVVPVVQIPGITLLVGGSAGATNPGIVLQHNVRTTHWYQN
jgi:type IV pilus assembly protein PilY1